MSFLTRSSVLLALTVHLATAAVPLAPKPMKQTAEEVAFEEQMKLESSPEERTKIAKDYLQRYVNDVPLGVYATNVMQQGSPDKAEVVEYLRAFAASYPRDFGPQYYYALAADDTLLWDEKARWALRKDSTNFWAWIMWTNAEWNKAKPDLKKVTMRAEKAVSLDSSRPEGFLNLGDVYGEQGEWLAAIDAYQAGLVCDPMDQKLRIRLEDAQDRLRKSEPDSEDVDKE